MYLFTHAIAFIGFIYWYYVGLPYVKGLSDEMSRILKKFNINVYTYPYKTIGNILPKIKDSVDDIYKRGAIYKIPCKVCSNVYVGETGRCFNTRLSEHRRNLKPINLAKLLIKEDDLNKKLHWLNIVLIVNIGLILGILKY